VSCAPNMPSAHLISEKNCRKCLQVIIVYDYSRL